MRLTWTEPALRDLASARDYVALDNPSAADDQVAHVVAAAQGLLRHPNSGRPGRSVGTRELVVSGTPYVVPYRVIGDIVQVIRVLHGRRRWPERL